MPPRSHFTLLGLLCIAALLHAASAQPCPVKYQDPRNGGRLPLLFGGVDQQCVAGCHRVNDYWTEACQHRLGETWGSCSKQQAARSLGESA